MRSSVLIDGVVFKRALQLYARPAENYEHVYKRIYPWKNLCEFTEYLYSKVLYNDGRVIAISKPFGVGTYYPECIVKNRDQIDPRAFGNVRYCIKDALPGLAERLSLAELHVATTCDRNVGGISVLGTTRKVADYVNRKAQVARRYWNYPMVWWCITSGIPLIEHNELTERVAIQKVVIDPRTRHVDFEIKHNLSKKYLRRDDVKPVRCQIKVLEQNRRLETALVEVRCSRIAYNFVRCYLSSKACFALGDPRFSPRVGRILGTPVVMPGRSGVPNFEPVPKKILDRLNVDRNTSIPLMIQMKELMLLNYPKHEKKTIFKDPTLPEYFQWSIKKLITEG